MNQEEEQALIEASVELSKQGGCPQDIWYPGYDWILRNGKPTGTTERFIEDHPELFKKHE